VNVAWNYHRLAVYATHTPFLHFLRNYSDITPKYLRKYMNKAT